MNIENIEPNNGINESTQISKDISTYPEDGVAEQHSSTMLIKANPLSPTTTPDFIKTPNKLNYKKACINIRNVWDCHSFKWCLVLAFHSRRNSQRTRCSTYNVNILANVIHLDTAITLDFTHLEYPVGPQVIATFEKHNPNISINVFGYDKHELVCLYYLTKDVKKHHVNLLLLHHQNRFHYILVQNMSRLLRSQMTLSKGTIYICNGCLLHFVRKHLFTAHEGKCEPTESHLPKGRRFRIPVYPFPSSKNPIEMP